MIKCTQLYIDIQLRPIELCGALLLEREYFGYRKFMI